MWERGRRPLRLRQCFTTRTPLALRLRQPLSVCLSTHGGHRGRFSIAGERAFRAATAAAAAADAAAAAARDAVRHCVRGAPPFPPPLPSTSSRHTRSRLYDWREACLRLDTLSTEKRKRVLVCVHGRRACCRPSWQACPNGCSRARRSTTTASYRDSVSYRRRGAGAGSRRSSASCAAAWATPGGGATGALASTSSRDEQPPFCTT